MDDNDLWEVDRGDYVNIINELRAEIEQAPTATLRQQLAGSQAALSKVMGELTEVREQLERRRIDYAKVQADLYNQIEAEKAQTAEAYRQRDVARAALAEAERDRDEERAAFDQAHKDALKWIYKAIEVKLAHDDLWEQVKRQRRTIRALVVAARAMAYEGEQMIGWRQFVGAVRETIRDCKQAGEADNG